MFISVESLINSVRRKLHLPFGQLVINYPAEETAGTPSTRKRGRSPDSDSDEAPEKQPVFGQHHTVCRNRNRSPADSENSDEENMEQHPVKHSFGQQRRLFSSPRQAEGMIT